MKEPYIGLKKGHCYNWDDRVYEPEWTRPNYENERVDAPPGMEWCNCDGVCTEIHFVPKELLGGPDNTLDDIIEVNSIPKPSGILIEGRCNELYRDEPTTVHRKNLTQPLTANKRTIAMSYDKEFNELDAQRQELYATRNKLDIQIEMEQVKRQITLRELELRLNSAPTA